MQLWGPIMKPSKTGISIEGGNIFCTIPVVLKRPADQTIKAVEIELMENEYFHLYYLEDVLTSGIGYPNILRQSIGLFFS